MRTVPHLELEALLRIRLGCDSQDVLRRRNNAFQRAIPSGEIAAAEVVIGFDTSSEILIERAASAARPFILDQSIAHPRSKLKVYERIRRQFPEWSNDIQAALPQTMASEDAEQQNASRISVASTFTRNTLVENGVMPEKISVNPYGVDLQRFRYLSSAKKGGPLKFLFAGLVCARKGIPPLLKAWEMLNTKDAELLIVGPITAEARANLRTTNGVSVLGKVTNVTLGKLMSECDVFVFPSYFEGFALVLLEAMASGLPVITTTATAGPDIITEGRDGWIIEPGEVDSLVQAMKFCLEHPERLLPMRAFARTTAERFSWDAYGSRWSKIVREVTEAKTEAAA